MFMKFNEAELTGSPNIVEIRYFHTTITYPTQRNINTTNTVIRVFVLAIQYACGHYSVIVMKIQLLYVCSPWKSHWYTLMYADIQWEGDILVLIFSSDKRLALQVSAYHILGTCQRIQFLIFFTVSTVSRFVACNQWIHWILQHLFNLPNTSEFCLHLFSIFTLFLEI